MFGKIKLILQGGAIGIANIIPGVSGGTIAVVLGVYEQLIEAISDFFKNKSKRKQYIVFLATIAIGACISIILFSWVMDYLLTNYSDYTYLFFLGLIAGSIPAIYKTHNHMNPTFKSILSFIGGIALIFSIDIFFPETETSKNIDFVYSLSLENLSLLFLGAIFAGGSMIVPGISGSFVLVVLGQYIIVIKAIKEFNLFLLAIIGLGAVTGVITFAKLINFLLRKSPKETFYFILGLVVASLFFIFPGMPAQSTQIVIGTILTISGGLLAFSLGKK